MLQLKSCGWILQTADNRILLLKNSSRGDWGLPKGHTEEGESEMQTALRELEEETSLKASDIIVDDNYKYEMNYSFINKKGQRINKKTIYYRANCKEQPIQLSKEHNDWLWAHKAQITQNVCYPELRHMLLESING